MYFIAGNVQELTQEDGILGIAQKSREAVVGNNRHRAKALGVPKALIRQIAAQGTVKELQKLHLLLHTQCDSVADNQHGAIAGKRVREEHGLKKMGFTAPGGGTDEDGVSGLPVGYLIPEGIRHILAAAGMHPVKGGKLTFPGSNGAGL